MGRQGGYTMVVGYICVVTGAAALAALFIKLVEVIDR